ncbi:MAG: tRNA pseudouridine(55) synthase TruB [Alphaproteobacteria bacterium]
MKKIKNNINGWLVVNKPKDWGSTDVVSKTRHIFNAAKNGHCGTLDPFATGVLPIAFGEATKLIEYVMNGKKRYEFIVEFGKQTNTDDLTGEVIASCDKIPSTEEIITAIPNFIGKIKQVPSKFSAIKINGQRAYDLARAGKEVDIPEREVEIYSLELLNTPAPNQAHMSVECSKGTYVRTLAKDLAESLNSLGHLVMLNRTQTGVFNIDEAIKIEDINSETPLIDITRTLNFMPEIIVSEEDAIKLKHGQGLSPKAYNLNDEGYATYNNKLIAIIKNDGRKIAPVKVFNL